MNILTANLVLSTLVFWLIARIYLLPRLPELRPRLVLTPILLLHAMRHLGLMFIEPGAAGAGMPREFAWPAAVGDFIASLLALTALLALTRASRWTHALIWIFNVWGTVDLVVAIALATLHPGVVGAGAAGDPLHRLCRSLATGKRSERFIEPELRRLTANSQSI